MFLMVKLSEVAIRGSQRPCMAFAIICIFQNPWSSLELDPPPIQGSFCMLLPLCPVMPLLTRDKSINARLWLLLWSQSLSCSVFHLRLQHVINKTTLNCTNQMHFQTKSAHLKAIYIYPVRPRYN